MQIPSTELNLLCSPPPLTRDLKVNSLKVLPENTGHKTNAFTQLRRTQPPGDSVPAPIQNYASRKKQLGDKRLHPYSNRLQSGGRASPPQVKITRHKKSNREIIIYNRLIEKNHRGINIPAPIQNYASRKKQLGDKRLHPYSNKSECGGLRPRPYSKLFS